MKIFPHNRSRFPMRIRQRKNITFEDVEFFLTAELTLLGPSLLFCIVIGQPSPLYLMAAIQLMGVVLGTVFLNNPLDRFVSCVPLTSSRKARNDPSPKDWKKAA